MALNDVKVKNAKAGDRPRKLFDGGGLYLHITPKGYKSWRFKFRLDGKEGVIVIGSYPELSLHDARIALGEERKLVAASVNPISARKQKRIAQVAADANTFESVTKEWHATKHAKGDSYDKQVLSRFEADIFPCIGHLPISTIKAPDVLKALRIIEGRGAHETARRMRQKCGEVFRFAVVSGYAEYDVTSALQGALAPVTTKHRAAITEPMALGGLLRAIDGDDCTLVVKCAMQLAPLVFVRPGELRKAEWTEFDLDNALWTIPAERMKLRKDHLVPLSSQALTVLTTLKELTGRGRYVFPSIRSASRPLSDNTLNAVLRRLGYGKDEMVVHGFRATARTILDEVLEVRVDLIEHQLAHIVRDTNGLAYNRTKFLSRRKEMMQQWADYLDGLKSAA